MALDFKRMFWKRNAGLWKRVYLGLDGRVCKAQLVVLKDDSAIAKFSAQLVGQVSAKRWLVVMSVESRKDAATGVSWVRFLRTDDDGLELLWGLARLAKTPTDLIAAGETAAALREL